VLTGMPFNQLGTLAGSGCYGLNAAYYYIRWFVCFGSADLFLLLSGKKFRVLHWANSVLPQYTHMMCSFCLCCTVGRLNVA